MNDQVLSRLRQDHDNLRPLLRVLEQQLECIEANGDAEYALMADILDYLVRKPDQYHYPFEKRLGQRLLTRQPAAADVVSRIRAQHNRLTRLGTKLQRRLDEIAADWIEATTAFQWTLDPDFTSDNAAVHRDLRDRIELALKVQLPQSRHGILPPVRTLTKEHRP